MRAYRAALAAFLLLGASAQAQDGGTGQNHGDGGAGSVAASKNGGVAGTGLGNVQKSDQPTSPSMSGTGQSVKGPPGQGIGGRAP